MNPILRTFETAGLSLAMLVAISTLPPLTVGGRELRSVDILADINPYHINNKETAPIVPPPAAPRATVAVKSAGGKRIDFHEVWPRGVEPIVDYSGGKGGGMDHVMEALATAKAQGRAVRVAYFSDSFTEGDIFTSDLRELMQQRWGGEGPGWVDAADPVSRGSRTWRLTYEGLTEHASHKNTFDRSRQTINQKYYTGGAGSGFSVTGAGYTPHAARWSRACLFVQAPSGMTVTVDGQSHTVPARPGVQMVETTAAAPLKSGKTRTTYRFTRMGAGAVVYGAAFEGRTGVTVDNFSMRGNSGTSLATVPQQAIQAMGRLRGYDLVVLHFGLNLAIKGNPTSVMRNYTRQMRRIIARLRAAMPEASVLVMGVTDRAQRTADGIRTLGEVKTLAALQQQMAADAGVAYYNTFRAMGGEGSMVRMVARRLASKDYTHLSYGGGRQVAQRVMASFEAAEANYTRRRKLEEQ